MSTQDASQSVSDLFAQTLSTLSEQIAEILAEGEMDRTSRTNLSGLYRRMEGVAAKLTHDEAERRAKREAGDEESRWMHTWWHHVGAYPYLFGIGGPMTHALFTARVAWLDELDAMTDKELLRVPGIGRRYLAQIREGLATYYWRDDEGTSLELWTGIARRLRRDLEYRYLPANERVRLLDGVALADSLLAVGMGPLDPTVPRVIS